MDVTSAVRTIDGLIAIWLLMQRACSARAIFYSQGLAVQPPAYMVQSDSGLDGDWTDGERILVRAESNLQANRVDSPSCERSNANNLRKRWMIHFG